MWRKLAAAALCSIAFGAAAQAEVNEVRMSKQFGLPYLPMIVIEAQQLIEKNAAAAGLGEVKTTWTQRAGPAAELDALLAGQADFIGPGVPDAGHHLGQDRRHAAGGQSAHCHAVDAVSCW